MTNAFLRSDPLPPSGPWPAADPFLFCVHHLDHYPASDGKQGVPAERLQGRALGSDFSAHDGFSMYHGTTTPGFPAHPHRGFETVTIVEKGLVDHSDSFGAAARYGDGDVQWLTAGRGAMHSEMFPLRDSSEPNTLDLFQIWLNLPARKKMADPAFRILWNGKIPRYRVSSANGATATVKVVAGAYTPQEKAEAPLVPPAPTPSSWAAEGDTDVAIWLITLEPGATLTLPPARDGRARRLLYFHTGAALDAGGQNISVNHVIQVAARTALPLANRGGETAQLLLLQGVPINEPVVAHGPFVMNTKAEIDQARWDFSRTQFGGWPWGASDPVHSADQPRFAKMPGGEHVLPPE